MQKAKDGEGRALNKRHAFGIKADVYNSLHWVDESTLTYPIGRNVVTHNVPQNAQKFFFPAEHTKAITALALTPSKKYIAIAESAEHPQIQIVETASRRRRRVLTVTDLGSDRFVAMEFSSDGRHLVTQGGPPQWNLLYWNWERSKPLAHVAVLRDHAASQLLRDASSNVVSTISINPKDPLHVVVSGAGLFRFYKYTEGMLKATAGGLGKTQPQNFTVHRWVTEERIILATDNADLLLIEGGELRCSLPAAPSDGHAIYAIEPTSKGFVCGADGGLIHIFEQSDDKELYRKVRTITLEPKTRELGDDTVRRCAIKDFALKNGEDQLAMVTTTQQIFSINFNVDWSKVEAPVFTSIVQPFHSAPIVGLDACIRKPLVVTSSTDHTVRIWNAHEFTCDVIKHFPSEPGAVAMHPSGLHVIVCFSDRVRLMNVYGDNLKEFGKPLTIRAVSDVKFSVGGAYFAVVHSNVLNIYNTYTCEGNPSGQLRGHTQKIKSFQWASSSHYPTDTRIVSCSGDGAVIDWNVAGCRKESDHIDKKFQYHAIASDDKNIWVVGTAASAQQDAKWKVKMRELEVVNLGGEAVGSDYDFDVQLTTLALASQHRLLFGGCDDGAVKLMTFPLQVGIHEVPTLAHSGSVNRLVVSFDENMLFSVGQDGSFYVFDIREDGRTGTKRETVFAEEILISKADLEDKNLQTQMLRQTVDDLNLDMDYQEKRRGVQHEERVKELTNQFQEESERLTQQFTAVWNAKVEQEQVCARRKSEKTEEFSQACAKEESEKQVQLNHLEELCKQRRATFERNRHDFALALQERDEEYERQRSDAIERFKEKVSAEREALAKLTNQMTRAATTNSEIRSQLEIDTDAEIENVKKKYDDALHKEREKYLHMKGENAIMRKNMTVLSKEIENRTAEVRDLDDVKATLISRMRELQAQIAQYNAQLEERDLLIAEKEKKIYDLKKKNQDLEKHKFVLDHTIRQLKSKIEPRQRDIAIEKEKIKAKDAELGQLHKNNLSLRDTIESLKGNIQHHQTEIRALLNRLKDFETYKLRIKTDIGELAQKVQDPEDLRIGIEKMYYDHVVARGGKRQPPLEPELRQEFTSHTEFLTRTVDALKRKVTDDHESHKQEIADVMMENLNLIKEIHELRKDIRVLKNTMQSTDGLATITLPQPDAVTGSPRPNVYAKEIESNRGEIQRLKQRIDDMERTLHARHAAAARPSSRGDAGKLPPIAGATPSR